MVESIVFKPSSFIVEKHGNIKDSYKITSCIGRGKLVMTKKIGAYGEVRKCQHKETKALRAVKIINKKCLEEEEKVKLYEFFQDEKRYFLVTE